MKKFIRSLLAKYLLIIFVALFFVQVAYLAAALVAINMTEKEEDSTVVEESAIEEQWHAEAKQMESTSKEKMVQHFRKWEEQYPESSMFWVDEQGNLLLQENVKSPLPTVWTPAFTAKFIKERYGGDPFTVIAFIGGNESNGFIGIEMPRSTFDAPFVKIIDRYGNIFIVGMVFLILLFMTVSFLFFNGIRKRLVNLQSAMGIRDVDGLPLPIPTQKKDEIGQLEQTFNEMILALKESKQREQKEEQLRRELIANLSHDLRTPLTKIRAQAFSIGKEKLSQEGIQSIKMLEASVVNIDRLIENLMSYTLLMADKYSYEPKELDAVRLVRECIATWYPAFEKEGFEIVADFDSFEKNWTVDPIWLGRIIDNLLQNVLRHASHGKYIAVKTESTEEMDAIVIIDKGPGMKSESNEKGAGIGLSIVDRMVKGMKLDWTIDSTEHGTIVKIINDKMHRNRQ